ncbi:hypothetical protein TeGR_g15205 [Tetraparma gracilis]|uniref:C2H2-type domain-containing protein n=1 Tax=Tetraparma gracilis TaxID=2962635 RepID=A0ABQ6MF45_9STRA|nr:hypothetical protein TeGR_g15205 [Tetraparma gracilis]
MMKALLKAALTERGHKVQGHHHTKWDLGTRLLEACEGEVIPLQKPPQPPQPPKVNGRVACLVPTCKMTFPYESDRKLHGIRVHSERGVVRCLVPTCEMTFPYESERAQHHFSHESVSKTATEQLHSDAIAQAAGAKQRQESEKNLPQMFEGCPDALATVAKELLGSGPDHLAGSQTADARRKEMAAFLKAGTAGIVGAIEKLSPEKRSGWKAVGDGRRDEGWGEGGVGNEEASAVAAALLALRAAALEEVEMEVQEALVRHCSFLQSVPNASKPLTESAWAALNLESANQERATVDEERERRREDKSRESPASVLERFVEAHAGVPITAGSVLVVHADVVDEDGMRYQAAAECVAAAGVTGIGAYAARLKAVVDDGSDRFHIWVDAPDDTDRCLVWDSLEEKFLQVEKEQRRGEFTGRLRLRWKSPDGEPQSSSIGAFLTRTYSWGYAHGCTSDHRAERSTNTAAAVSNCRKMLNMRFGVLDGKMSGRPVAEEEEEEGAEEVWEVIDDD